MELLKSMLNECQWVLCYIQNNPPSWCGLTLSCLIQLIANNRHHDFTITVRESQISKSLITRSTVSYSCDIGLSCTKKLVLCPPLLTTHNQNINQWSELKSLSYHVNLNNIIRFGATGEPSPGSTCAVEVFK